LEVLQLVRDDSKNKQIAERLSISEHTVNCHIKSIIEKLGAHDPTHAVSIAILRGLIQL
jgi:DNA-binding NarL/FixJ family response regulator